jgi:hypothetical protein
MGKYIGVLVITAALLIAVNCSRHQSPAAVTKSGDFDVYIDTATATVTDTNTLMPTFSYTHTYTRTITYTLTPTKTPTITPTFTPSFTATSTNTPLPTPLPTATNIGAVEGGSTIHGTIGHTDSNCTGCNMSVNCASIILEPLGWEFRTGCPGGDHTGYVFFDVPIGTYTVLGNTIVVTDGGDYTVPHHCLNYDGCPNF